MLDTLTEEQRDTCKTFAYYCREHNDCPWEIEGYDNVVREFFGDTSCPISTSCSCVEAAHWAEVLTKRIQKGDV